MKLHLGCGKRHIEGFIHVDLADFPHIDHKRDIRDLSFLPDESVELIYCCHALGYFSLSESLEVLREWNRVLISGGTLRLAVPDFKALAKLYEMTGNLMCVIGPICGEWQADGETMFQKSIWDFDALSVLLRLAGFRCIRYWDWQSTKHRDVDDHSQSYWPHMDKDKGLLLSLNMEADKA